MGKLKVAVIGIGAIGKSHARIYSDMDDIELEAVCDINKDTCNQIAKKYNTNGFTDYKRLSKVDAVSICLPTKLHTETALFFINKGINVLIEKPISININEGKKLINFSSKKNVKLMIGHVERFNPIIAEIKKRIANGSLGKIYNISTSRLSPFPHRIIDVGVTIDLAVHDIDILMHLNNSKINRIYAETCQKIHANSEDMLNAMIKFENEVVGIINTNWLTPKKVREITITAEKGMFIGEYLTQDLYFYKNEFAEKYFDYSKGITNVIEGDMIKIKVEKYEPLKAELESFIDCIVNNKVPAVTGYDGLRVVEIATKILDAAKHNKVISL